VGAKNLKVYYMVHGVISWGSVDHFSHSGSVPGGVELIEIVQS
jgi:hypothetical protein